MVIWYEHIYEKIKHGGEVNRKKKDNNKNYAYSAQNLNNSFREKKF